MYDCLLGMSARSVPAGAWRTEVVDVARWSSSHDGWAGRVRELAGVVAFGLRLRSVRATAGRPTAAWAQGAALGAVLLLATALAATTGDLAGPADIPAATAIAGALLLTIAGRPGPAATLSATALALAFLTSPSEPWTPAIAALTLTTATLTFATHSAPRRAPRPPALGGRVWSSRFGGGRGVRVPVPGGWVWSVLLPVALLPVGIEGGAAVVGVVATLVVPIGLLVVGGADARLAVAAAVAWGWRFLALDPADVLDTLAALRSPELPVLLVRLMAMAWGLGLAVVVAHRSTRRATAL